MKVNTLTESKVLVYWLWNGKCVRPRARPLRVV